MRNQDSYEDYDPFAEATTPRAEPLADYASPAVEPTGSGANGELTPAERYRLQYANVPFYGDTTHRSTYMRIEPPARVHAPPSATSSVSGFRSSWAAADEEEPSTEIVDEGEDTRSLNDDASRVSSGRSLPYQYSDVPFYGQTTSRAHFTRKIAPRTASFKRTTTEAPYRQDDDRDRDRSIGAAPMSPAFSTGSTTHRSEYGPIELPPRTASFRPASRSVLLAGSAPDLTTTPSQITTTHRLQFAPKPLQRTRSLRPRDSRLWREDDVGGPSTSTSRAVYEPKELPQRPFRPRQIAYRPRTPERHISTHRAAYSPKALEERPRPFRPKALSLGLGADGQLQQATSVTTQDYQPWDAKRRSSFKPTESRLAPGSFLAETTSRETYVPKTIEPCPAELLLRSKSDFRHVYDRNGHRFYKRMQRADSPANNRSRDEYVLVRSVLLG